MVRACIANIHAWTKNHTRPVENTRPLPKSWFACIEITVDGTKSDISGQCGELSHKTQERASGSTERQELKSLQSNTRLCLQLSFETCYMVLYIRVNFAHGNGFQTDRKSDRRGMSKNPYPCKITTVMQRKRSPTKYTRTGHCPSERTRDEEEVIPSATTCLKTACRYLLFSHVKVPGIQRRM